MAEADTVGGMRGLDIAAYLRRLGVSGPVQPTIEVLRILHAAHVEQVPYQTLDFQLGRTTTLDPYDSAERIARRGRGGYCFHLNGAFGLLLTRLGFDATFHRARVQRLETAEPVGHDANHLAMTVDGLPSPENPHGRWLVDVGLGRGFREPLPLHLGTYRQDAFSYTLGRSRFGACWRFDHEPYGLFTGFDIDPAPARLTDFEDQHIFLSTSPDSGFVQTPSALRRDADWVDHLKGCTLTRVDGRDRVSRVLDTPGTWFGALTDLFGIVLDCDNATRTALWRRAWAAHEAWAATPLSESAPTASP
jgi:arylamine N-acetyltransferase